MATTKPPQVRLTLSLDHYRILEGIMMDWIKESTKQQEARLAACCSIFGASFETRFREREKHVARS